MRLSILTRGHRWTQKIMLQLMTWQMGHVPGPVRVFSLRPRWFGLNFLDCLQDGLRNRDAWNKSELELFAAFVSKLNRCEY